MSTDALRTVELLDSDYLADPLRGTTLAEEYGHCAIVDSTGNTRIVLHAHRATEESFDDRDEVGELHGRVAGLEALLREAMPHILPTSLYNRIATALGEPLEAADFSRSVPLAGTADTKEIK